MQPVTAHGVEERPQLPGVPGFDVALLAILQRWSIGQRDDVADDGAFALGVVHRLVEHQVDVAHRLRGQPGRPGRLALTDDARRLRGLRRLASLGQQGRVENVEIVGCQPLDRSTAERRQHVEVDIAPVRVVGAGTHPRLLDRQPPIGEVLPEGELLGRHRHAVVAALDLLGEHLLGVAAPGPRGDPRPALPAGPRIDAVVDDGVVVVALLLDASAHGAVPFDVDSERDATQRSRPIPGRPTGGALPTSDHTEVEPERRESIVRARPPTGAPGTDQTIGRGEAAVPLRDVPAQPVTTRPNPQCRNRCRSQAR